MRRVPPVALMVAAFAAVIAGLSTALADSSPDISIVDLRPPAGMWGSRGGGIDSQDVVAATLLPSSAGTDTHVGLWADGAWRDFGIGTAVGMASTGEIVGYTGPPAQQRAAVWTRAGGEQDLGSLPDGAWSQATAANTRGDVVGYARGSTTQAVVWRGGSPDVLPSGTGESYAYGINDAGDVVGSDAGHAVVWTADGRTIDLGAGDSSVAYAINASGLVVGDANGHAFSWSEGTGVQYLPLPPDAAVGAALAINAAGAIVGDAQIERANELPVFHAVLWQDGQVVDLTDGLPADSGWELGMASAIGDDGSIVGTGVHDGQTRAFVLHLTHP